jgi:cytochrome b6-f complex iron-sulfur subunit
MRIIFLCLDARLRSIVGSRVSFWDLSHNRGHSRGAQMDRKEFLNLCGMGVAAAVCSYCLEACTTNGQGDITAPSNVDFTLDLTTPSWSSLTSVGAYVYDDGLVIAHTTSGYVALSQRCTHAGTTVVYDSSTNQFFCPAHGSRFSTSGSVINGPASQPLATYKTSLNGSLLRVTS